MLYIALRQKEERSMNQIINMIIRQVMNQVVRRGVNAGFDKLGSAGKQQQRQNLPADAIDDYGNPVQQQQMTQEERRQKRQARQSARQAKQSMTAVRRVTKF
jgi:hypothetical protein